MWDCDVRREVLEIFCEAQRVGAAVSVVPCREYHLGFNRHHGGKAKKRRLPRPRVVQVMVHRFTWRFPRLAPPPGLECPDCGYAAHTRQQLFAHSAHHKRQAFSLNSTGS